MAENPNADESRALRPAMRERRASAGIQSTRSLGTASRRGTESSRPGGYGVPQQQQQRFDDRPSLADAGGDRPPSMRAAARIVQEMFDGDNTTVFNAVDDDTAAQQQQQQQQHVFAPLGEGVRVPDDDDYDDAPRRYDDDDYAFDIDADDFGYRRGSRSLTWRERARGRGGLLVAIALVLGCIAVVTYSGALVPSVAKDARYHVEHGFGIYPLPEPLEDNVVDWTDVSTSSSSSNERRSRERPLDRITPLFWNVPLSGGDLVEKQVTSCLRLVQASEVGVLGREGESTELQIVQVFGDSYVNVDTTTTAGLKRSVDLGLVESGLADVIFSPMVYESTALFSLDHQATMFTLLRHPVDRAVSMYYYLREAKWDPMYDPEITTLTLDQYAASNHVENNWLTRMLVDRPGGPLTEEDVATAKEILRRKFHVGLFHALKPSLRRFDRRFGWTTNPDGTNDPTTAEERDACADKILGSAKNYDHPTLEEGSKTWDLLLQQNLHDLDVYEFSEHLYKHQNKAK